MFQVLLLPVFLLLDVTSADQCSNRSVHLTSGGKNYHFSWRDQPDEVFTWSQGRKYCKNICMDLVSLETKDEWDTVVEIFNKGI